MHLFIAAAIKLREGWIWILAFTAQCRENNPPSISSSHLEKKLDKIFDKVTEQGNQMLMLKEKGEKTLDSITNLENKLR